MYNNYYVSAAGLGEFRIRDLNDEINKLLREKRHWEERIVELGGADYTVRGRGGEKFEVNEYVYLLLESNANAFPPQRTGPKMLDHEGKTLPGNRGYK